MINVSQWQDQSLDQLCFFPTLIKVSQLRALIFRIPYVKIHSRSSLLKLDVLNTQKVLPFDAVTKIKIQNESIAVSLFEKKNIRRDYFCGIKQREQKVQIPSCTDKS